MSKKKAPDDTLDCGQDRQHASENAENQSESPDNRSENAENEANDAEMRPNAIRSKRRQKPKRRKKSLTQGI
jgi:hypothetical protein